MPFSLDRNEVRKKLENFDLRLLFVEDLGWDYGGSDEKIVVAGDSFFLKAVAQKRGMVAYQYVANSDTEFPDHLTRQKIERILAKNVREHVIVYATHDRSFQYWQWVKREPGRPDRPRRHIYHRDQPGESLIQKLENLVFTLDEEDDLTIVDVSGRIRAAFDVENVTKKFYISFKRERDDFLAFIDGVETLSDREWYASLMLNRMMFIYFIQKRGFLDNDVDYLHNRLKRIQSEHGKDRFQTFYRLFLLRLFHEGLSQPVADRVPQLVELLGKVPYLNGGLFDVHELERDNDEIHIPDEAFQRIFQFFDAYQWHLDDRPLRDDKEINPDVLGYIFEKYINQKQMGAYYTKEDITGYISRNTVIPFLFDWAKKECPIAFESGGGIWRLLQDDPDRYFPESARHGITYDIYEKKNLDEKRELPPQISAGLKDISQRDGWNKLAPKDYALATETWREHVDRRRHYEKVCIKLASGEVKSINDFVTYNLDIEKFIQDVIASSEGPELIRAFWKAITKISILDPTCGSGAFLFSALNILEPIYVACLDAMHGFLDDLKSTGRKHHPKTMSDFREVLAHVEEHTNERYFILKSIVVENLYGVDIMDEAVEICKLRLFLKLVAQLESYDQIEPLPDIDFNIRSGNTLVGFTSLEEVKRALGNMDLGDMVKQLSLPRIEGRAEIADKAFGKFREMQTTHDVDAGFLALAKANLREQLDGLRAELDSYLADEYGVKIDEEENYGQWRDNHRPFHWFVEFYGIMRGGGFNVIIGNPPYLEIGKVPYSTKLFSVGGPIHAMCIERCLSLCEQNGGVSMIVPLSLVSTHRMTGIQKILERDRDCWYSNFAERPGRLFEGVDRSLTIFVTLNPQNGGATFSTAYLKWYSDNRSYLMSSLRYIECHKNRDSFYVPKLGHDIELSIFGKYTSVHTTMADFEGKSGNRVYYRNTGGRYWKIFTDFSPKFYIDGVAFRSSREVHFSVIDARHIKSTIAILSSDIFWWWYTITSNLRDLNPFDLRHFPVPESAMNDIGICDLGSLYIKDLQDNSTMDVRNRKTGRTEEQSFQVRKSKEIINEIDAKLAAHYGFNARELDFLVNYDIKYRTG